MTVSYVLVFEHRDDPARHVTKAHTMVTPTDISGFEVFSYVEERLTRIIQGYVDGFASQWKLLGFSHARLY
jgi:hypothetical protein